MRYECRQFPRASGYPEDPATGSAAAAFFDDFSGPFSQSTAPILENGSDLRGVQPATVSRWILAARQYAGRYGRRLGRSSASILSGSFSTLFFWIFGDTNRPKHSSSIRQRRRSGRRPTPHATRLGLLSSPVCRTPLAIVGLVCSAAGSIRTVWAVWIGISPRRQLQVGMPFSTPRTICEEAIVPAVSFILVVHRLVLLRLSDYALVLDSAIFLPYPKYRRRRKFQKIARIRRTISRQLLAATKP